MFGKNEKVVGVTSVQCGGAKGALEKAVGAVVIVTQQGKKCHSYVRCSNYGSGGKSCNTREMIGGRLPSCIHKFETLDYS